MVRRFEVIYAEIIQQRIEAGASVQVEVAIRVQALRGLQPHQQRVLLENARSLGLTDELQ
ncbi:hypothetical protein GCM10022631_29840 [Deinococcus rubellus]|uniref:hypothetical protein n=1 Tax=Deinococcus rubellus TaxID=1889240 RepID=UPI0031EAA30D